MEAEIVPEADEQILDEPEIVPEADEEILDEPGNIQPEEIDIPIQIEGNIQPQEIDVPSQIEGPTVLITFTLQELRSYTHGFHRQNIKGKGSFGCVYKGVINGREEDDLNGRHIAVKMSHNASSRARLQWEGEINYLPRFNHPNIIQLIGKCETTRRFYLVYPLLKRGNVRKRLSGLNWSKTLNIMKGAALALQELQTQTPPLVLRDFKSDNILLDRDFNAILTDFGTIKPEGEFLNAGTIGYTDPAIMWTGLGTRKTDMYSMGVLILQMVMKKKCVANQNGPMGTRILNWATEKQAVKGHVVHKKLRRTGCTRLAAEKVTSLGLECLNANPNARPTIQHVLQILAELDDEVMQKWTKLLQFTCIKTIK